MVCTVRIREAVPERNSVDNQGLTVHLSGLLNAHQIQHGGGDVSQTAVPQLHAGTHNIEGYQVGGMGGEGLAVGVDHTRRCRGRR